jgi:hypothetical protein
VRIIIRTAPLEEIRNNQCGDWIVKQPEEIEIIAGRLPDPRHSFLIAIHELIEAELCRMRGITDEAVTKFDAEFERTRIDGFDEAGDHTSAPYHREHVFATNIERLLAAEMGVNWVEYEIAVAKFLTPRP